MSERIEVAVDVGGRTIAAGTLHVTVGRTLTSSFQYGSEYLRDTDAYALAPQMSLLDRLVAAGEDGAGRVKHPRDHHQERQNQDRRAVHAHRTGPERPPVSHRH